MVRSHPPSRPPRRSRPPRARARASRRGEGRRGAARSRDSSSGRSELLPERDVERVVAAGRPTHLDPQQDGLVPDEPQAGRSAGPVHRREAGLARPGRVHAGREPVLLRLPGEVGGEEVQAELGVPQRLLVAFVAVARHAAHGGRAAHALAIGEALVERALEERHRLHPVAAPGDAGELVVVEPPQREGGPEDEGNVEPDARVVAVEGEVGDSAELRGREHGRGEEGARAGPELAIARVVDEPCLPQRHAAAALARRSGRVEEGALLRHADVKVARPEVPAERAGDGATKHGGQEKAPIVVAVGWWWGAVAGRHADAAKACPLPPVRHESVVAEVQVHHRAEARAEDAALAPRAVERAGAAGCERRADGRLVALARVIADGGVEEERPPDEQPDVTRVGADGNRREVPAADLDRGLDPRLDPRLLGREQAQHECSEHLFKLGARRQGWEGRARCPTSERQKWIAYDPGEGRVALARHAAGKLGGHMIRRIVALAALALSAASVARAEPVQGQVMHASTAQTRDVQIGLGVGIEPLGLLGVSPNGLNIAAPGASFYVPIQLNHQLRIEPSIGFRHLGVNGGSDNAWALGVGGLFYFAQPTPAGFYVGGRLGLAHFSTSTGSGIAEVSDSATDFSLAPVLGAEYAFASKFTIGAEFQLPITFIGNASHTAGGTTTTNNVDRTGISTNAVLFFRYFL